MLPVCLHAHLLLSAWERNSVHVLICRGTRGGWRNEPVEWRNFTVCGHGKNRERYVPPRESRETASSTHGQLLLQNVFRGGGGGELGEEEIDGVTQDEVDDGILHF